VSTETSTVAAGEALATAAPAERGSRRGRRVPAAVMALAVAAAVVLVVVHPLSGSGGSSGTVSNNGYPTSTQSVLRESISQQTQVSATLGYGGDLTIRLPAGNAPATVTAAQQTVTTDQGMLSSAQSSLQGDSAALSLARATLAAYQQQERIDCAGDNAAQVPAAGGGSSAGSGGCATDAQSVASAQQSVTANVAKVSADQSQVSSAEHALAAAGAALVSANAQATPYGQGSTFTGVPSAGEIVRRGQRLLSIDGEPVVLLYGPTVATRAFGAGMSPGADVAELNENLDALGYAHGLTGDAYTAKTATAVRHLQGARGEPQTGELLLGSVVFEQGPVRVTSLMPTVAVGSSVMAGPVLSASWVTRQVSMQLDAALEGQVKVGDLVTITLPDNRTTPGRISYVSSVASSGQNGSTIAVDAVPTDPTATGELDQAPVNVSITTASVNNVLVVPVDALLALSSGGYAVEEVGAGDRHFLVPISTGLFDDANGLVQVSGSSLAAGQRVVVPGQ